MEKEFHEEDADEGGITERLNHEVMPRSSVNESDVRPPQAVVVERQGVVAEVAVQGGPRYGDEEGLGKDVEHEYGAWLKFEIVELEC